MAISGSLDFSVPGATDWQDHHIITKANSDHRVIKLLCDQGLLNFTNDDNRLRLPSTRTSSKGSLNSTSPDQNFISDANHTGSHQAYNIWQLARLNEIATAFNITEDSDGNIINDSNNLEGLRQEVKQLQFTLKWNLTARPEIQSDGTIGSKPPLIALNNSTPYIDVNTSQVQ